MMKRIAAFLLILLLVIGNASGAYAADSSISDAEASVLGVAGGFTYEKGEIVWLNSGRLSIGSCFGVGKPWKDASVFITSRSNVSAIDGKGNIISVYDFVYLLPDGADIYEKDTLIKCSVLWSGSVDTDIDIAIIKAEKPVEGVKPLPIEPTGSVAGDKVYTAGSDAAKPLLSGDEDISEATFSGEITGFSTIGSARTVSSTAQVNALNVGGPLINADGNVIGVSSLQTGGGTDFSAVEISYALDELDELEIAYTDASKLSAKLYEYRWYIVGAVVLAAALLTTVIILKKRANRGCLMTISLLETNGSSMQPFSKNLEKSLMIGRDTGMDIVFPDNTKGISRKHCRIDRCGDTAVLTDLKSSFGTFLNGKRLEPEMAVMLNSGDIIELGSKSIALVFNIYNK